jgi:DNA-binding NarL/FixJ family response regulator
MKIRIFIADDHRMFAEGIQAILGSDSEFHIAGSAPTGKHLLAMLRTSDPADVILMDVSMPEMGGLETTRHVRKEWPKTKIIVLTMHKEPGLVKSMLEAGADGFILKNTGKTELEHAIRTVMSGETYFSKEVMESMMHSYRFPGQQSGQEEVRITKREKEVLKLIVDEKTAQEIADQLCISQHTVDSHRKNLLSKLEVRNTAGLVKYALRNGIVGD